jgi:hypothetical protein
MIVQSKRCSGAEKSRLLCARDCAADLTSGRTSMDKGPEGAEAAQKAMYRDWGRC